MCACQRERSGNTSSRADVDFEAIGIARRVAAAGNATTQTMPQQTMPYSQFQTMPAPPYAYAFPWGMMIPVPLQNVTMPISGPQERETCAQCALREMEEELETSQRGIEKFRAECTEDALAISMERIKELRQANDVLQNELAALGDEYTSLGQEFKKLGRLCMDTEHVRQVKTVLAQVGGKCERLHGRDGSLHDMANAAVAQHRRMTKLLEAVQQRHAAARQTFDIAKGHLKRRERAAIDEQKAAQRECAAQERRARQLTAEVAEHKRSTAITAKEMSETKDQLQAAIAKNIQLERKYLRAKAHATTFFDEKKEALNEREDAIASVPMCAICMARDVQLVVNLPCGHACACKICSDTTRPCAICRGDVTQAVPIYFVSG